MKLRFSLWTRWIKNIFLAPLRYNSLLMDYSYLRTKYEDIMRSEKVVVIYPEILLKGLENVKNPIYLEANHCLIKDTTLNGIACTEEEKENGVDQVWSIRGNNSTFQSCTFK